MINQSQVYKDDQWIYELDKYQSEFLRLPNKVMELICRMLPTRADQANACLIHPTWKTAARNILWESPRFHEPASFRAFLGTVQTSKNCALAVRSLRICVDGLDDQNVFKPIDNSNLKLHQMQHASLSNPEFIRIIASRCEKLTSLTIYGYQLEPSHVEVLAGILSELTELHIIGSKHGPESPGSFRSPPFIVNSSIFPRIRSLNLDGVFDITTSFAATLATRCHNLQSLHISLAGMSSSGLDELCNPGVLNLKELVFTHATHIKDYHMEHALKAFPRLTRLAVEGTGHITVKTIRNALGLLKFLEDLDIRGDPAYQLPELDSQGDIYNDETWTVSPNMYRLAIHHLGINNKLFTHILRACPSLTVLGISDCEYLTDEPLEKSFNWLSKLEVMYITQCRNIGSQTINAIIKRQTRRTIKQVNFEGSGDIKPSDIYQLCLKTHMNNLKWIRLINYPELMNSTIGSFASEFKEEESVMVLNEQAIELLVNTPMDQYSDLEQRPEGRYLSGDQIFGLAKELQLSLSALEKILNKVQLSLSDNSEQESDENSNSYQALEKSINSEYNTQDTKSQTEDVDNSTERTTSQLSTQWPTIDIKSLPKQMGDSSPEMNRSSNQEYTSESERDVSGSLVSTGSFVSSTESPPERESNRTTSKSLGGWAPSDTQDWNQSTESSASDPIVKPNWQTSQNEDKQKENVRWNTRMASTSNPTINDKDKAIFGLEEGWGNPENVVPWEQTKGYVHEVLEAQSNATFWEQTRDGGWNKLSPRKTNEIPPPVHQQRSSAPTSRISRRRTRGGNFRSSDDSSDNSDSDVIRTEVLYRPTEGSFEPKPQTAKTNSNITTRPRSQSPKTTNLPKVATTIDSWNQFRESSALSPVSLPSRPSRLSQPRPTSLGPRKKQGLTRQAIPPAQMSGNWGSYSAQATVMEDARLPKLIDIDDVVQPSPTTKIPESTGLQNPDLNILVNYGISFDNDNDNEIKEAQSSSSESMPQEIIVWSENVPNSQADSRADSQANSHQEQNHWGGLAINNDMVTNVTRDDLLSLSDGAKDAQKVTEPVEIGAAAQDHVSVKETIENKNMSTSPPSANQGCNKNDIAIQDKHQPILPSQLPESHQSSTASVGNEKSGKRATLKIPTNNHGLQNLMFYQDSDLNTCVEEFCKQYGMEDQVKDLLEQVEEPFTKWKTNIIMNRRNKSNKKGKKAKV
ncbi:hypothetical protein CLU79DRAFT_741892 [Phycomyces nitens]|nr:hypothetical protein CLU79DRAFT_741892 [Phycomyces nitens]